LPRRRKALCAAASAARPKVNVRPVRWSAAWPVESSAASKGLLGIPRHHRHVYYDRYNRRYYR
jgi:hypothetical protein